MIEDLCSQQEETGEELELNLFEYNSGLDGTHWTLVDLNCPRFQRLVQRRSQPAEKVLQDMGCVKAPTPPSSPESQSPSSQHRNLTQPSLHTASNSPPIQVIDLERPQRTINTKKRSRKQRDEVTEEENKEMDGEYWLIDASSDRLQRRMRRKAEYAFNPTDLGAELDFTSPNKQKKQQIDDIISDLRKKLIKRSQTQFGAVITLLNNSETRIPQFLRIYHRNFRKLERKIGIQASIPTRAKHITFDRESNSNRDLNQVEETHWNDSMRSLELARLNIQEITASSDEDAIISSDDDLDDLLEESPTPWNDYRQRIHSPDRKRRKISHTTHHTDHINKLSYFSQKKSLRSNTRHVSRVSAPRSRKSVPKRNTKNLNVIPVAIPSTMNRDDYLQTLRIPQDRRLIDETLRKFPSEPQLVSHSNVQSKNTAHMNATKRKVIVLQDYSIGEVNDPKTQNSAGYSNEPIVLHLPPSKYTEPHLHVFPRNLYLRSSQTVDTIKYTAQHEEISLEFNLFVQQLQISFATVSISLDNISDAMATTESCCVICYTKQQRSTEISELMDQSRNSLCSIRSICDTTIEKLPKDDEGDMFREKMNGMLMYELLKIWRHEFVQTPLIQLLTNARDHCKSFSHTDDIQAILKNNAWFFFAVWIRVFLVSFFRCLRTESDISEEYKRIIEILICDISAILIEFPALYRATSGSPSLQAIWTEIILFTSVSSCDTFWKVVSSIFTSWKSIPSLQTTLEIIRSHHPQELPDSLDTITWPSNDTKETETKTKTSQASTDDLIEVIWLIIFETIPLLHSHDSHSLWKLIETLINQNGRLLTVNSMNPFQTTLQNFSALVDETGNIRNWILSSCELRYIKEVLSRLVQLSNRFSTHNTAVTTILMNVFEHFRAIRFYDRSGYFPQFLRDFNGSITKQVPIEEDSTFGLFVKLLFNHLIDVKNQSGELQVLKLSSKFFGKLLTKQQQIQILEDGDNVYTSSYYLAPLRNSISLLLTFGIFYPSKANQFTSLVSRLIGLFDYKKLRSTKAYQIVVEGIYMIALMKQSEFCLPVTLDDSEIKSLVTKLPSILFTNQIALRIEPMFVVLSKSLSPLTEHIIAQSRSNPLDKSLDRILTFSIQCIQLLYSRTESAAGKFIAAHSFLISPLLPYFLEPKAPLSHRYVSCKLISNAFTALVVTVNIETEKSIPSADGPTEEQIEVLVRAHEHKKTFQRSQFLSGMLLCQIINESGVNKKLLALPASVEVETLQTSTSKRFIAQTSRTIGEMAASFVYYGKEKWFYFYGRFGSSSKWIQPTAPSIHREIPARIFANAIVFFHRLTEANEVSGLDKLPAQVNINLDELEIIRLWIFLMIEPCYSSLQGLFTHALVRKFKLIQLNSNWIIKLLPKDIILPLCENHQKIFEHRKKLIYSFLDQLCDVLLHGTNVPSQENISVFYNWFQSIPRRFSFMLLKELPSELVRQGSQVLVEHTKFCYSVMGRLLSHCTFLLYRPKFPHCVLPMILSTFFKTNSLDLSYRLQYIPRVIEAFGKLSEIYSIEGDQCLQREFKELFNFYWLLLVRNKSDQKRIIHAWAFAFAGGNYTKLRRFLLMKILFPKFCESGDSLQIALKVTAQIIYSVMDNCGVLDDICAVGSGLISLMTKRGTRNSLADRVVINSFWMRMLNKVQSGFLEPDTEHCLFRRVVELFVLLLLDDLFRLLSSTLNVPINHQQLSVYLLRAQEEIREFVDVSLDFTLSRVLDPYPAYMGGALPHGIVERIFSSLDKISKHVLCGKWFLQKILPIFHEMVFPLCNEDRVVAKNYKNFLGNLGNFGFSYLCYFSKEGENKLQFI